MWFRVDDKLHSHPKRHVAGLRAMGLWAVAGSWCGDQLTDGFVPSYMLTALGGKPADAKALVDAGLWVTVDGGWEFTGWHEWNPSRETVEARREADREKKAKAREKKKRLHAIQGGAS